MTLPAGTNLDISLYCDEVLGYFYFRKSNGFIDTDLVDQELSLPYEHCDIAMKKLETDGFIEVFETSDSKLAKITPKGEVYYRTSSYKIESKTNTKNNTIEKIRAIKDVVELVVFLFTIFLGVYTFSLNKELKSMESEIQMLKNKNGNIENLKRELEILKSEITQSKSFINSNKQ